MSVDKASHRAALADALALDPAALEVEYVLDHPDLLVFRASAPGSPTSLSGTFDGTLELDLHGAIAGVLALARDDPMLGAKELAAAVGALESMDAWPFLDQDAIDLGGDPQVMAAPRLVTIDGVRTLEFWNASARHGPWRTRLAIHHDGTFALERTSYTAVKGEPG